MDVGIDQPRHQPLAADIDGAGALGDGDVAAGADGGDFRSVDDHHGVLDGRRAGAVD